MLDVHPPHESTHTWRDFFIHIATICIGLLIAVGLEQTVELFHHQHQRHQLEADLHNECLRNIHIALGNIKISKRRRNVDAEQYAELLRSAQQHRAPISISPFSRPEALRYVKPAYAVWTVAQQSDALNLLPRADVQRYVRVNGLVQMAIDQLEISNAALQKTTIAALPAIADTSSPQAFVTQVNHQQYDLSLLTPEERQQLRDAVGNDMAISGQSININAFLYGIEWAVLHGSTSDEENIRIIYDAQSTYWQGGTKALLEKYPPPVGSPPSPAPAIDTGH
ncbi:hypothetical protein [Granulicella sp. L46]|uniref:hypothetical protein n=1 Tax=Granulicella sp. L46 TaxID=1641865 RepID=UPI00131CFBEB|nr:hypothetical protein [Granulicella sp. L46]